MTVFREGTAVKTVMPCWVMILASADGSPHWRSGTSTSCAPAVNGHRVHQTEGTKQKENCCMTLSFSFKGHELWRHDRLLTRLRCVIIGPLGAPVEPEVYITYARLSELTFSVGFVVGSAASCCRSESRLSTVRLNFGESFSRKRLSVSTTFGRVPATM